MAALLRALAGAVAVHTPGLDVEAWVATRRSEQLLPRYCACRLGTVETGDREMVVTYPDGRREVREIHRPALGAPPPGEEGDSDDDPER